MIPGRVLRFTIANEHGRNVVRVAGDIDIDTAPDLQTYLCGAVDANLGNASRVVAVDLSHVTFMDTCGLAAVVSAEAQAHQQGVRLHLIALPPSITRLLRITGLDRHFALCPTREDDHVPGTPAAGHRPAIAGRGTQVLIP